MGLRLKVIATLVVVIIPVSLLFSVYRFASAKREIVERRADRVAARMDLRAPERCSRNPAGWMMERRGMRAFAYDTGLESRNRSAPTFPPKLARELSDDVGEPRHVQFWFGAPYLGATGVRVAESGPCAVILVLWRDNGHRGPPVWGIVVRQTLVLALVLTVVGLLISVPLVRRVRRLTEAVDAGHVSDFDNPEAGGRDELAELAETFGTTLAELNDRDRTLKEYIANTTHDLAIPLTVLQHRLQRLTRGLEDDEHLAHVRTALEESHYIAGLIANMSAAAKLESDQVLLDAAPVDLGEVVQRVVGRHEPIAEQKDVELNWSVPETPVVVRADSTLVEQALSNLVQNAVQYNSAGGHVSVVLDVSDADFELRVADDGPGIPDALLDDVATRGVRSDEARSRNEGGQGFGLGIARAVCDQHGWLLSLDNMDASGLEAVIRGSLTDGDHAASSSSDSSVVQ
jgi:signal transduction histidine kinase